MKAARFFSICEIVCFVGLALSYAGEFLCAFVAQGTEYLQILSSVLSGEFETIKATGVEDALDTLQTITVDAICSDFNMKDGTGLDLLEKIRQQGLKTPFLLMSGDNSRALEQKAKLYYGDFCCKTDFDFVEKIKALVNN